MIDGLTFDSDPEDFQERLGKGKLTEEEGMRGYVFNKVKLDGLDENAEVSIMLTSDNKPAWVLAETELPKFDFIGSVIYSPAGKVIVRFSKSTNPSYTPSTKRRLLMVLDESGFFFLMSMIG